MVREVFLDSGNNLEKPMVTLWPECLLMHERHRLRLGSFNKLRCRTTPHVCHACELDRKETLQKS